MAKKGRTVGEKERGGGGGSRHVANFDSPNGHCNHHVRVGDGGGGTRGVSKPAKEKEREREYEQRKSSNGKRPKRE